MKKIERFYFGALLSLSVFLFFGCSESSRQSVVVATHRKEIAAYIEAFNTEQDQYRMELQFIPEGPIAIPSEGPVRIWLFPSISQDEIR
jgi:hypothetical protein